MKFMILDSVFERYTIVINDTLEKTHVHCDECDMWVLTVPSESIAEASVDGLYELIVREHDRQLNGEPIRIADPSKTFITR
jgi:hypothetical protein